MHSDLTTLQTKFRCLFAQIAKERPQRQRWLPIPSTPHRTELEWVTYEREQMFQATNKERSARGLPTIDLQHFCRVAENPVVGHSDYERKFSLYCAELVLEVNVRDNREHMYGRDLDRV